MRKLKTIPKPYNMKLHKILLLLVCLPISTFSFTQDSLLHLLTTDLPDTTRIDVLGKVSRSLLGVKIDSSIIYAKEAVDLATTIKDKERKAYMLKNVGLGHYYKGEFLQTLNYWEASLAMFEERNQQSFRKYWVGVFYYWRLY